MQSRKVEKGDIVQRRADCWDVCVCEEVEPDNSESGRFEDEERGGKKSEAICFVRWGG